jgi:hypothetical protein
VAEWLLASSMCSHTLTHYCKVCLQVQVPFLEDMGPNRVPHAVQRTGQRKWPQELWGAQVLAMVLGLVLEPALATGSVPESVLESVMEWVQVLVLVWGLASVATVRSMLLHIHCNPNTVLALGVP